MYNNLNGLLALAPYEDLRRDADAARLRASAARGRGLLLRRRLGRALLRLGAALAEGEGTEETLWEAESH